MPEIDIELSSLESNDRISLLEMQLKAMKNLFSLQEKIFAENGLNAAIEANIHQKHQKFVNLGSGNENENDNGSIIVPFHKQNDRKNTEKTEKTEKVASQNIRENVFKSVKLDSFPYLKLLELWRTKCFHTNMERLQTEKVREEKRREGDRGAEKEMRTYITVRYLPHPFLPPTSALSSHLCHSYSPSLPPTLSPSIPSPPSQSLTSLTHSLAHSLTL